MKQVLLFLILSLSFSFFGCKKTPESLEEALKILTKAAEQGNKEAQSDLGVMYYNGHGVAQDYKEAGKWLRKAAEQGVAQAQKLLVVMYIDG